MYNGFDGSIFCQRKLYTLAIIVKQTSCVFGNERGIHWFFIVIILQVIIRDRQLFGMVAVLLLVDFIILLTWQLVDPLTSKRLDLTLEVIVYHSFISVYRFSHCCSYCSFLLWWRGGDYRKGSLCQFTSKMDLFIRVIHYHGKMPYVGKCNSQNREKLARLNFVTKTQAVRFRTNRFWKCLHLFF